MIVCLQLCLLDCLPHQLNPINVSEYQLDASGLHTESSRKS